MIKAADVYDLESTAGSRCVQVYKALPSPKSDSNTDVSDSEKIVDNIFNVSQWIPSFRAIYEWFIGGDDVEQKNLKAGMTLEYLPDCLIKEIGTYLNPPNIVRLSHVCKDFRVFFDSDFWVLYNLSHNYKIFYEEISYFIWNSKKEAPPLKVALANYYYEIGIEKQDENLIKQSSILGLSQAKKYLQKKEDNSTYYMTSDYGGGYDYRGFCRSCMAPYHHCRCGGRF